MANNNESLKWSIISSIEAIKSVNDDPELSSSDDIKDTFIKDVKTKLGTKNAKTFGGLKSKASKSKDNKTNIFKDLNDICDSFMNSIHKVAHPKNKLPHKGRLTQHIFDSADITIKAAPEIIRTLSEEVLFAGDGICGSDTVITGDTLSLDPGMFDFLNMFTIDPSSPIGQICYESIDIGGIQLNRELYELFNSGTPFNFSLGNSKNLFNVSWDEGNQKYNFSGLTMSGDTQHTVGKFIKSYYSKIQHVHLSDVKRMALLMLLLSDDGDSKMFTIGLNEINRLLEKLFADCNTPQEKGLDKNSPQFEENDQDNESYFDFDNVEGIDLDDESRRLRKVMKFVDCGNIEVPIRPQHLEDFVYLSKNDLDGALNDVLENFAVNACYDSGNSANLENFHIELRTNFNLAIPTAMICSILSPKFLLPIIIIYKLIKGGTEKLKEIMKKLWKLFTKLIKKLYWLFINEFWNRVKRDLLDFLKTIALNILKEKFRRYYMIIASLIALIKKILNMNLDNCNTLYTLVAKTIETALSAGSFNINPMGFLLSLSALKSGYSPTRAINEATKRLNGKGVNTKPIFGKTNHLNHVVSSIIKGHDHENSNNSKVMSGNLLTVIPVPGLSGPITILPGQIKTAGVKF